MLKEALHGSVKLSNAADTTREFLPFAYLLTALLFARSGLYSQRGMRPGLARIVGRWRPGWSLVAGDTRQDVTEDLVQPAPPPRLRSSGLRRVMRLPVVRAGRGVSGRR